MMAGIITPNHLVSGLVVLLTVVTLCEGLICYNCHTNNKAECGDHFRIQTNDIDHRFECKGSCFKRRGKRSSGEVRRTEVQRGCMVYKKDQCYSETFNNLEQYTCVCNTNFCNGAAVLDILKYFSLICISLIAYVIS